MANFDEEEFEDDDDLPMGWVSVEPKPITKYTFIHFFLTIIVGFLRTLLEATANFGDAVMGEEVYKENKKDFEDDARLAIETIVDGKEE